MMATREKCCLNVVPTPVGVNRTGRLLQLEEATVVPTPVGVNQGGYATASRQALVVPTPVGVNRTFMDC